MTLILSDQAQAPVFDRLPLKTGKKSFFTRRFISLAGKPVLAEKNLPIAPSTSELSQKCYVSSQSNLFKANTRVIPGSSFKPGYDDSFRADDNYEEHANLALFKNVLTCQDISFHIDKPTAKARNRTAPISFYAKEHYYEAVFNSICPIPPTFSQKSLQLKPIVYRPNCLTEVLPWTHSQPYKSSSSLTTAYKGRAEKHIAKFCHIDNILPWEHTLLAANTAFSPILGADRSFALSVGISGQVTCNHSFLSKNIRKQKTAIMVPALFSNQESFDTGRELINNLLIEHHTQLQPSIQLKTAKAGKAGQFSPLTARLNAKEPKLSFLTDIKVRKSYQQPNFNALPKQLPAVSLKFNPTLPLKNLGDVLAPFRFSQNHHGSKGINSRIKLRLKLRLIREKFADGNFSMAIIANRNRLKLPQPTIGKLNATFGGIKQFTTAFLPFEQQTGKLPGTCRTYQFSQKRNPFMITAFRHVRYTLRHLKQLEGSSYSSQKCRQANSNFKFSSDTPMALASTSHKPFSQCLPLWSPLEAILLRPISFLMYISAPNFTDIFLPIHRRRLKAPAGLFPSSMCKSLILRRKTTLRSLRFRLHAIVDGFRGERLKIPRQLQPQKLALGLVLEQKAALTVAANDSIAAKISPSILLAKSSFNAYQLDYKQRLPLQARATIALPMDIIKGAVAKKLEQKNFIFPQSWPLAIRLFACRLRLHPYPFGFPTFLPEIVRFVCLAPRQQMQHVASPDVKAQSHSDFILRREKPAYSPVSMKQPKRLMHRSISVADLPKDFFMLKPQLKSLSVTAPAAINSFQHAVLHQRFLAADPGRISAAGSNSLEKRDLICASVPIDAIESYFSRNINHKLLIKMPGISVLLLRARKFRCRFAAQAEPVFRAARLANTLQPATDSLAITKLPLKSMQLDFLFKNWLEKDFNQSFSRSCLAPPTAASLFRGRFRLFRFPYRPEFKLPGFLPGPYACIDDAPVIADDYFADEIRASEFNFCITSTTIHTQQLQGYSEPCNQQPRDVFFINWRAAQDGFMPIITEKILRLQQSAGELVQQFNLARLLKAHYSGVFRFKKVVKSLFKLITPPTPAFTSFPLTLSNSKGNEATFSGMYVSSPHWIILLKPSRQLSMPCKFLTSASSKDTGPSQNSFYFKGETLNPEFSFNQHLDFPLLSQPDCLSFAIHDCVGKLWRLPSTRIISTKAKETKAFWVIKNEQNVLPCLSERPSHFVIANPGNPKFEMATIEPALRSPDFCYRPCRSLQNKATQFVADRPAFASADFRHAALPDWYDIARNDFTATPLGVIE